MKIKELLKKDGVTVSFEVFPPKSEANYESIYNAAMNVGVQISLQDPDFNSYG